MKIASVLEPAVERGTINGATAATRVAAKGSQVWVRRDPNLPAGPTRRKFHQPPFIFAATPIIDLIETGKAIKIMPNIVMAGGAYRSAQLALTYSIGVSCPSFMIISVMVTPHLSKGAV
jgi:hypothetical protein